MPSLAPIARQQFIDENGAPYADGKLFTYAAGTTTPLATYSDADGTENANPIVLTSKGLADVWIGSRSYKFVLKDVDNNTIWTRDNISNPQSENGFTTGDVKLAFKSVADSGWVMMNDTTIGSADSGATGRAASDTIDLYTHLWNEVSDSWCAVSTGRGASAAEDFAANKTLALPKALGRALISAGAGSGLSARALGEYLGAETHALSESELATHTHTQTAHTHTDSGHTHTQHPSTSTATVANGGDQVVYNQTGSTQNTGSSTAVISSTTAVNQNTGSGTAHNNMQPSLSLAIMIKL